MPYENSYSGAITITPALTRTQIRNSQVERMRDVKLRIVEQQVESDGGETFTVRQTADAIVPLGKECSGNDLEEEIQFLVDAFAEHQFAGFIEVQWDQGFKSPPSRFVVKDGRVVRIDAEYRWPGEWDGA